MRRFIRAAQAALTFSSLTLVGCECADVNLGRDDAGRRDAGSFRPRTDECGNGIDDDRNGRIDDGCVCGTGDTQSCFSGDYPGHGIGACRDGVQTCAVQEFGDWGMFTCVGETLPSAELCDGIDNDCDGARDEDCPCEASATRACSDEFATAPCMPGTQTCRGGTWSRCEGAVGPTADVCGDAIDNDCDGLTNEGCTCTSTPEQCNDRIDNDCDGDVDEVTCAPLPDAGMSIDAGVDAPLPIDASTTTDAALPPPEGCPTLAFPDFRDRIVWETQLPNAGQLLTNIGGHSAARIAGDLVALDLRHFLSGPYTFGGEALTDDQVGYLSFSDGTARSHHGWAGPGRTFDTSGDHLAMGGLFSGTLDVGLGAWTSDPTLYTTGGTPPALPAPDFYMAQANVPTGAVVGGRHFASSGIPAHPMSGSFWPTLNVFAVGTDVGGNLYIAGRFQGRLDLDGHHVDSSSPYARNDWGAWIASFSPAGALRWLDATAYGTNREMVVDASGRYVALIRDELGAAAAPPDQRVSLELRDATTGAVLFSHRGSRPSGLDLLSVAVDSDGNVTAGGQTGTVGVTLGGLMVPAYTNYVASFDRAGALRWSHALSTNAWPNDASNRFAIATNGTEVAVLLGLYQLGTNPVDVHIGTCARRIEKRVWVRGNTTGRPVMWAPGTSGDEVQEGVLALLDARTGEHRWSRLVGGDTSSMSLAMHPRGDLILALHGSTYPVVADYGAGPLMYGSHIFRIRNR